MTKPTIFVTRRWPAAAEEALAAHFDVTLNEDDRPLTKDELAEGFASHDVAAPTVSDVIDDEVVRAGGAGRCRMIANYGVGVNHIDLSAAASHGITVSNTPGVLTDATADLTLTLMLMLCRRAGEGDKSGYAFGATAPARGGGRARGLGRARDGAGASAVRNADGPSYGPTPVAQHAQRAAAPRCRSHCDKGYSRRAGSGDGLARGADGAPNGIRGGGLFRAVD